MKPKVLLINLPYVVRDIDVNRSKIRSFLAVPYGLLSIATYNKEYAHTIVIDCDAEENYRDKIIDLLWNWGPDIVGFSMMFDNSYKYLAGLIELVRSIDENTLFILGGAAASYSYEEIFRDQPHLDAICYSEGEIPFRDLLVSHTLCNSAWITRLTLGDKVIPKISFVENLNDTVDIDYSYIEYEAYDMRQAFSPFIDYSKPHNQFFLVTSRGCPFKCSFCSNASIHGKKMRFIDVDSIIKHVKHLVNSYGMDVLTIYDDQLLIDMPRAKELFKRLTPFNLRIECPNGLSVRYIDQEMADVMRGAGLDTAYLAIESGSSYVLKELINKPLKLEQVEPAVKALRSADFFIHGFFVMGMPGETDEHRRITRDFIQDIDIDWCGFNMATPVRGSKLYADCIKNGWIKPQKLQDIVDKKYIIHVPGTNPIEIERCVYEMNIDVNFTHNRRMRIGGYKTAAACFKEVLRRYPGHKVAQTYLKQCEAKIKGGKLNGEVPARPR